jgi:hypothetical protein
MLGEFKEGWLRERLESSRLFWGETGGTHTRPSIVATCQDVAMAHDSDEDGKLRIKYTPVDHLSDHPTILEHLAMPLFPNPQNVTVNDGIFVDVGGNINYNHYQISDSAYYTLSPLIEQYWS